ncbi:MAG: hypothetical protein RI894_2526 [Bacteroidota bacterium]|jgi:hypothetical protein
MKRIDIYVEGPHDQQFIADCLAHFYKLNLVHKGNNYIYQNQEIGINLYRTNGWSNLTSKHFFRDMRNLVDEDGGTNLVIFDADKTGQQGTNSGGFEHRRAAIEKYKSVHNVDFELFLFPNNQEDGTLEALIRKIVPEKMKPVLNCLEGFNNCINKIAEEENITITAYAKEKIDTYKNIVLGRQANNRETSFLNDKLWDLNMEGIKPLKDFLDYQFSDTI